MSIDQHRIATDIEAIAGFSESPAATGHSRPTFSPAWRRARDYVIAQAKTAGCTHRIDAAGNVFIRHASLTQDARVWLSGSHLDSVPTGGKFDGVMGVVVPLEVLRGGAVPLELVIWAEEEGTTFGIGMIGSRLAAGALSVEGLQSFRNGGGQNFFEAGQADGVRPSDLVAERFLPQAYRGLVEVHAEQGPALWSRNVPLAVVTAIAGRKQYRLTLTGQPNHAGSTPMNYRRDALVAAARIVTGVQSIAEQLGDGTVATVGKLDCEPNAINVIPGVVRLTVDLRSPEPAHLAEGHARLEDLVTHSGLEFELDVTEDQPVAELDADLVGRLQAAGVSQRTVSGALHDAAVLAPLLPTAMLFVASKDGISHNPAEFSRTEDIAAAAAVLDKLVRTS